MEITTALGECNRSIELNPETIAHSKAYELARTSGCHLACFGICPY